MKISHNFLFFVVLFCAVPYCLAASFKKGLQQTQNKLKKLDGELTAADTNDLAENFVAKPEHGNDEHLIIFVKPEHYGYNSAELSYDPQDDDDEEDSSGIFHYTKNDMVKEEDNDKGIAEEIGARARNTRSKSRRTRKNVNNRNRRGQKKRRPNRKSRQNSKSRPVRRRVNRAG